MTNTTKRAVAYARYSSEMQRAESIDAQLRAIKKYAEENGIALVGEYIDRAKSGRSDDRPQFLEMIRDAREGLFDLVIVHQYSRFARNRADSIIYTMELQRHGVRLVSVLEPSNDTPEDDLLRGILETLNEYYSQNLGREVEKGKKENAIQGKHVGGIPPLGYDVDRETMLLTVNERESRAVQMIFQMHISGCTYGEIEQALDAGGYLGKNGKPIGKTTMHSVLSNEKYTGMMVYNKSAPRNADGRRNGHKYKDESEIIKIDGLIPALVSKEDFQKAQEIMGRRRHKAGQSKAKEVYLLSGKVVCGTCGSNYCGNRRQTQERIYISYTCNKKSAVERCRNGEIRRDCLESFVLDKLASFFHIKSGLQAIKNDAVKAANTCDRTVADIEEYSRQYHTAGRAIKNMARMAIGKKPIDAVKESGKLAKVLSAPYKAGKSLNNGIRNQASKMIAALDKLEHKAEVKRDEKAAQPKKPTLMERLDTKKKEIKERELEAPKKERVRAQGLDI